MGKRTRSAANPESMSVKCNERHMDLAELDEVLACVDTCHGWGIVFRWSAGRDICFLNHVGV